MSNLLAEGLVRDVPDFPKPGILFKDITPVMQDYAALKEVAVKLAEWAREKQVDAILSCYCGGVSIFRILSN